MNIIKKLPKTALPIKNAINQWIDIDGTVYGLDNRNHHKPVLFKKAQTTIQGYKHCGICYKNGVIDKRVHRLVAEAFIPNPNNYNIVGHKNNIKSDNRVENLYWTTTSENTKKAFDDRLIVNTKGFDDSQSKPVNMYDTYTNKLLNQFGSICEASKTTGVGVQTISRQAKYKRPVRKPFYFRYIDDKDCILNQELIGMFDYETDKLIKTFINISQASKDTNIPDSTISYHILNGKPKYKFQGFYFKKLINNNKCEETIENLVGE